VAGFVIEGWARLQDFSPVSRVLILGGFTMFALIAIGYFGRVVRSAWYLHQQRQSPAPAADKGSQPGSRYNMGVGVFGGKGINVHDNLTVFEKRRRWRRKRGK
jgi:hypothetical protein